MSQSVGCAEHVAGRDCPVHGPVPVRHVALLISDEIVNRAMAAERHLVETTTGQITPSRRMRAALEAVQGDIIEAFGANEVLDEPRHRVGRSV